MEYFEEGTKPPFLDLTTRKEYPHYLRLNAMICGLYLPVGDSQSFPASSLWLYDIFDTLPLFFN